VGLLQAVEPWSRGAVPCHRGPGPRCWLQPQSNRPVEGLSAGYRPSDTKVEFLLQQRAVRLDTGYNPGRPSASDSVGVTRACATGARTRKAHKRPTGPHSYTHLPRPGRYESFQLTIYKYETRFPWQNSKQKKHRPGCEDESRTVRHSEQSRLFGCVAAWFLQEPHGVTAAKTSNLTHEGVLADFCHPEARGSGVGEAVSYMSEGRGFHTGSHE
jgi:hypothetical protein